MYSTRSLTENTPEVLTRC